MRVGLFIPVCNEDRFLRRQADSIRMQKTRPDQICVVDSSTRKLDLEPYAQLGAEIKIIESVDFDHGGTRNLALEIFGGCEIVSFLTHDAILASPDSLRRLCECFSRDTVGAAYGRQRPHEDADHFSKHARHFNYPGMSTAKSLQDAARLGLKTPFISNSFSAYRKKTLQDIGGFPEKVILGEDMFAAGRVLLSGQVVAYCAEAEVYHSHNYSSLDEFRRYFDTGVFHRDHQWLLQTFGRAEGEGRRFVLSELRYLLEHAPGRVPEALLRTVLKYLGYRLGRHYDRLPRQILPILSMNRGYWKT
ncbi:MAG: glycosyltransferase [Deltaproteobacteria bacterium]|nr:MAG: glycosyltransferase [Deltaproteobacteria bacterium]